ncbi:DUF3857 domain-containing protein [Aquimarina spongiae]|uniref:DUF3857 domain-containing protein n=1 Tax=Aquimarina spongiae TaxID=570521 RepID=A0A1M6DZ72_9FLAO|nr:DUF3857 domain-containing protein [Aquimarina spongiae]SHI78564.1 protein of unknown function [Aquimarina spongiae]
MLKKILPYVVAVFVLYFSKTSAQEEVDLKFSSIDTTLLKDANAVVLSEDVQIEINAINSITVKNKRIVTVLNKYGRGYANSAEGYDPSIKIKKLEATVYDAYGKETKKYKKKDFKDRSRHDGISLMNDDRMLYFDYTPVDYPYTLVFESEVQKSSTAFITPWLPLLGYRLGVQKSSYTIVNNTDISIRYNETNFEGFPVQKDESDGQRKYTIDRMPSRLREVLSPSYRNTVPMVRATLNEFYLQGVKGAATDWKTMGKWQYDKLLTGRDELSQETINEVGKLTEGLTTKREKAKRIYEYVQGKTRYISVQLGVGGWMPFLASDVDRLGYGDCKALTNYTKALLDSQGILSYYTVVFANERRDIDPDFAAMQGNHVILNIPEEDEDIWLECTSQTAPFDFIGDFTDDRNVLVVTPDGGEIKRTKRYEPEENMLHTQATINLGADASMVAEIKRESKGLEYDWNNGIRFETPKDQKVYYKELWGYVNNLEINSLNFENDVDAITFNEEVKVSCRNYMKKVGSRLLVAPNAFSCDQSNLPKYEDRKMPLEISRGYVNTDEYIIHVPQGYTVSSVPDKKIIETEFGKYSWELEKIDDASLKFKRYLKIKDGTFPKEKYEEYRKFRADIKKIDKSKIVLKQL